VNGGPPDLATSPINSPLFSVIILNVEWAPPAEECLDSVSSQSFRDFETIVVDNGSTDGSVDWLKAAMATRSPPSRFLRISDSPGGTTPESVSRGDGT